MLDLHQNEALQKQSSYLKEFVDKVVSLIIYERSNRMNKERKRDNGKIKKLFTKRVHLLNPELICLLRLHLILPKQK
jgi:hypothetical protein